MQEVTSSSFKSAIDSIVARLFRCVATRTRWPWTSSTRLLSKPIRIDWCCKILLSSILLRLPTSSRVLHVFLSVLWVMHVATFSLSASCLAQKEIADRPLPFLTVHLLTAPCLILQRSTASSWVSTNVAQWLLLVLSKTTATLWCRLSRSSSVRIHV
jgi:hypothetical protein